MEGGAGGIQTLGENGTGEAQSSFPAEIKGSRECWPCWSSPREAPERCACPAEFTAQSPCPVASAQRAFPQHSAKFGGLFLFIQLSCHWRLMLGLPELCNALENSVGAAVPGSPQNPSHQMHFFVGFFFSSCCSVFHFSPTLGLL